MSLADSPNPVSQALGSSGQNKFPTLRQSGQKQDAHEDHADLCFNRCIQPISLALECHGCVQVHRLGNWQAESLRAIPCHQLQRCGQFH